jgi:arylsulfatase A-like enzyme
MPPPNLVLIMADDLGYGDLGCFGSGTIRTPHLDRLAADGLLFTDYHANGAVCTPTRAALLTGRYQQRCGLEEVLFAKDRVGGLDPATACCPVHTLRRHGYATAIFGKWHLGYQPRYNPVHHGFDLFRGYVSGNVDYHSHVDGIGIADWWHNLELADEPGYVTDLVSGHAVQFIRAHRDRPFFLYVAHEAPHFPYQGRHDKADRAPGRRDFPGWGSRTDRRAAYKEMIEAMDDGVGRIVDTLREQNLADRTLVLFCSDNGAMTQVGSNGCLREGKGSLFEGGHRVPAIARWPGRIAPGGSTGETVLSMDWLPTCLALAGCAGDVPAPLDGVDLTRLLCERAPLPERTTFFRYRNQAAARRGRWKLLRDNGHHLLFDLAADLAETTDLAARAPDTVRALDAELAAWEQAVRPVAG